MIIVNLTDEEFLSEGFVKYDDMGVSHMDDIQNDFAVCGVPIYGRSTRLNQFWVPSWAPDLVAEIGGLDAYDTQRVARAVLDTMRAADPVARAAELISTMMLGGVVALDDVLDAAGAELRPSAHIASRWSPRPIHRRRRWI